MTYDSNLKTSYWAGTISVGVGVNGLLQQQVLPNILGTEVTNEVMDTGDGSTVNFSGTLANFPVGKRRLIVSYTISSVVYTASDDGAGVITGTHCVGTLDHDTGDWTLDFDAGYAPDNFIDITGSYLYGNPGADWRQMYERPSRTSAGVDESFGTDPSTGSAYACVETILHNTGSSGIEDIYIGIREWVYSTGSACGWDLNIYTYYNAAQDWNVNKVQHGLTGYDTTWKHWATTTISGLPIMPLAIGTSTGYRIYSTQNKIIVAAKISTKYEVCYLGNFLRYALSADYPLPGIVKGPLFGNRAWTNNTSIHTMLATNPSGSDGYSMLVIGADSAYKVTTCSLIPRDTFSSPGTLLTTDTLGRSAVAPIIVLEGTTQILGELEGAYLAFSQNLAAEDILVWDSVANVVMPDPYATAYYDFTALADHYITT